MSDCLVFAVLFATYGVLGRSYARRPRARSCSSCRWSRSTPPCCCSPRSPTASRCWRCRRTACGATLVWLAVTGLFGLAFLGLELHEFAHLIHEGAGPQRSAFLSSFFTLVGTHGLHVTFGIVWLVTLMVQLPQRGLIAENKRRLMCLCMFWHFLDVVWIGVFTFVYLMGVSAMSASAHATPRPRRTPSEHDDGGTGRSGAI